MSISPSRPHFGEALYLKSRTNNIPSVQFVKDQATELSMAKDELFVNGARGLHPDTAGDQRPAEAVHLTGIDAMDFLSKAYQIPLALIPAGSMNLADFTTLAQIHPGFKAFINDTVTELNQRLTSGFRPVTDKLFAYAQHRQFLQPIAPLNISEPTPVRMVYV